MVSIGTGNRINPRVWPAGFTAKEKQLVVSWKRRAITSTTDISYFASSINDFLSFEAIKPWNTLGGVKETGVEGLIKAAQRVAGKCFYIFYTLENIPEEDSV